MCNSTNKRLIKICVFHIWFVIKFWLNRLVDNHHFLTSFVDDGNLDYIKNIFKKWFPWTYPFIYIHNVFFGSYCKFTFCKLSIC